MSLDTANIEAIIFDLGDVIINLDFNRTKTAFEKLSGSSVQSVEEIYRTTEFFKEYEEGSLSDAAFRDEIRRHLKVLGSDQEIDQAWNKLLGDIPFRRAEKITELGEQYQLFVMSNTNAIHWKRILEIWNELETEKSFYYYFNQVYLSYELGVSKPHKEAWLPIIQEHDLNPACTLFIDDREENIQAASALGLQVFHNVKPDDWLGLF